MGTEDVNSWSSTASDNATADAGINMAEGMAPGEVNDGVRSVMAAVAKWLLDNNGTRSTAGSAGTYTYAAAQAFSNTPFSGLTLCVKSNFSSSGTSTLNVTPSGGAAWGAKQIQVFGAGGILSPEVSQIRANGIYLFVYDATALSGSGAWILLNPSFPREAGATTFTDTLAVNGNTTLGNASTDTVLVNAGSVTQPNMPAFLAYNSSTDTNQTGNGATATVDFDTELFDRGGDFSGDTFTAPVTGLYQFSGTVTLDDMTPGTTVVVVSLVTTGRTFAVATYAATTTIGRINWSLLTTMTATNTATVQVTCTGMAGNTVDITGGASSMDTHFSGFLVG